jgi:hypothetical protein
MKQYWFLLDLGLRKSCQHFHLLNANAFLVGLPLLSFIGPLTPFILAQNDFRLAALFPVGLFSVTGACKLLPVARLYFALPLAVSPPFRDFSPRPTDKLTPFFFGIMQRW